jgi:hypothetical protein
LGISNAPVIGLVGFAFGAAMVASAMTLDPCSLVLAGCSYLRFLFSPAARRAGHHMSFP